MRVPRCASLGLVGIELIYFSLRDVAADEHSFGAKVGRWDFWLYNGGLVLWIVFNFFPIGWPQLDAVYEHGLAYARSQRFYDTAAVWQSMHVPDDVVFALAALLMAGDFIVKLRSLFPRFVERLIPGSPGLQKSIGGAS
jgi:nitric oxide reductase subunit B